MINKIKFFVQTVFKGQFAFTIIEIIIVILIIGFLTTLTLANYRTGQRVGGLITETQKIVGVFKQAQNMALTGYGSIRTDCGYGIYFISNTSYRLFIDKSSPCNYQWDEGTDEAIQDFTLAANIILSYPAGCQYLVFKPPSAEVCCCCALNCNFSGEKIFTVQQTEENRYLYIRVNSAGKISISW
ncbi:MAG: hypothetical protein ACP5IX_02885 [Patescibacteria group bacterium]